MQDIETPEYAPSFDLPVAEDSFASGLSSLRWGLLISAAASVAMIPILVAVIGQTETFDLIVYPALLSGGIIGAGSVLVAGVVRSISAALRDLSRQRREPKVTRVPGRLAMD